MEFQNAQVVHMEMAVCLVVSTARRTQFVTILLDTVPAVDSGTLGTDVTSR